MFGSITKKYSKLPGNTFMRTHSLWIGEHHLLYVRSRSFYEDYWRFSFEDIQAVSLKKTHTSFLWAALFGIFAALFSLLYYNTHSTSSFVLAIAFIVFFIINLMLGSTCVCYLHTEAQTRKLPSLGRLKNAKKAIHLLKKEISKHQGQQTEE